MRRLFSVLFLFLFSFPALSARSEFVTLGTGDITGVYYPAGGAICRLINKDRAGHGIRCAVESTPGSGYNLTALKNNDLDLAIVQADWLFFSNARKGFFTQGDSQQSLRLLMNLHSESFTIVARKDSDINTFNDLKGKKLNVGIPGSGHRKTFELLMEKKGWHMSDFALASELAASDMAEALCQGKIDAFVYFVGHPNTSIREATSFCDSKLISLPKLLLERLHRDFPFYYEGYIPGGMYRGNADDVATFNVDASLVASEALSDGAAYTIVKLLAENQQYLRNLHPALSRLRLDTEGFLSRQKFLPLHKGARHYYLETKEDLETKEK